jgi:hypothetical protein
MQQKSNTDERGSHFRDSLSHSRGSLYTGSGTLSAKNVKGAQIKQNIAHATARRKVQQSILRVMLEFIGEPIE